MDGVLEHDQCLTPGNSEGWGVLGWVGFREKCVLLRKLDSANVDFSNESIRPKYCHVCVCVRPHDLLAQLMPKEKKVEKRGREGGGDFRLYTSLMTKQIHTIIVHLLTSLYIHWKSYTYIFIYIFIYNKSQMAQRKLNEILNYHEIMRNTHEHTQRTHEHIRTLYRLRRTTKLEPTWINNHINIKCWKSARKQPQGCRCVLKSQRTIRTSGIGIVPLEWF